MSRISRRSFVALFLRTGKTQPQFWRHFHFLSNMPVCHDADSTGTSIIGARTFSTSWVTCAARTVGKVASRSKPRIFSRETFPFQRFHSPTRHFTGQNCRKGLYAYEVSELLCEEGKLKREAKHHSTRLSKRPWRIVGLPFDVWRGG